jgi:hypothetical protein
MDKKNYISEQYVETTQNIGRVPIVTYDEIMNRLTRHFIREEPVRAQRPQYVPEQKTVSASSHVTNKITPKTNNEKMPGYVRPYRGQPPSGQLNTPVQVTPPVNQSQPQKQDNQSIDEKIQAIIDKEKRGEMGVPNNINQVEMENKLLLMRKIAQHNNKIMLEKNKATRTQMKFQ